MKNLYKVLCVMLVILFIMINLGCVESNRDTISNEETDTDSDTNTNSDSDSDTDTDTDTDTDDDGDSDGDNDSDTDMDTGTAFVDEDGDGWIFGIDCDDENPDINQGEEEIYDPPNGVDEDCDGLTDESPSDSGVLESLYCPENEQFLLILDFRSGWLDTPFGGSAYDYVLPVIFDTCPNINIEYAHIQRNGVKKRIYTPGMAATFEQISYDENTITQEEVVALFNKEDWDEYTQLWVLSGSSLDQLNVNLSGAIFDYFNEQTGESCIPIMLGTGSSFITHSNEFAEILGIGSVFEDSYLGGWSDTGQPTTAATYMYSGVELGDHLLFCNVDRLTDKLSTGFGSSIINFHPLFDVIATSTDGHATISYGALEEGTDDERPILLESGLQRFYSIPYEPETVMYLQNIVMYLSLVGCMAVSPG